jgi:hypothetical protein
MLRLARDDLYRNGGLGAPRLGHLLGPIGGSAVYNDYLVGGSRLLRERVNQLFEAVAVVERRDDDEMPLSGAVCQAGSR